MQADVILNHTRQRSIDLLRTSYLLFNIYILVPLEHIVRYIIPAGDSFGPNGSNVEDSSYDGIEADGILRNGLGQLIDGIFADESEAMTSSSGTNWVGWSNRDSVQLIFEFDDVREFVNCTMHVANLPQHDIEVCKENKITKETIIVIQ